MTFFQSWLPSKNVKRDPVSLAGLDEARYIDAFHAGYLLAMTQGMHKLETTLLDRAATQVLDGLSQTIEHRAIEVGASNPRQTIELQNKIQEFISKRQASRSPSEKEKYDHYVEALQWAVNTNGH